MKKLVVLGAGESGVGTAILGKKQGYSVFVSDKGKIAKKYRNVLLDLGIEFEEGSHSEERTLHADLVMKSPGIPDKVALVQQLKQTKIPVVSEIEFAAKHTDAVIIGITGSNGKTTTTMLAHHFLYKEGLNVGMAGNIGDSFAKMVAETDKDHYVLEISSFQLDGIKYFRPHVAIITNITPDHLDRYENKFENYIASKFRITMNQEEGDYLIYDADDPVISEEIQNRYIKAKKLPFSIQRELEEGAHIKNEEIMININNNRTTMPIKTLNLQGQHNLKNAMAASMAARLVEVRKETIRQSLQDFQGAPHRLEKVLKINNVQYINDSKATNVNATFYALDSVHAPTVWIAGGEDKGNDYTELLPLVREKVKAIICLGLDNSKIIETFGPVVDLMVETYSMSEAVKVAYKIADRGNNVLLSPACASFDLFKNYEDRGDQFKEAVRKL